MPNIQNKMLDSVLLGHATDLMSKLPSESVNLIVTDIPYGIDYKSNKQNCDTRGRIAITKHRPQYFNRIVGDTDIPIDWLPNAYRLLKQNSAIYIFCHWSKWHLLLPAVAASGFTCKNMIVMNKSNHGMGDLKGQYAPKHELLLFATKGRHLLHFPDKRLNDIWDVPVKFSGAKRHHPNEKPVSWLQPCILNSSDEGDLVLDPFCGSGSTGVAANQLNRQFLLIDIDNDYVTISKDRLGLS